MTLAKAAAALLEASERHIFGDECKAERDALRSALATQPKLKPSHPLAKMVALDEEFGLYDEETVEPNAVIGTCHSCDVPHKVGITGLPVEPKVSGDVAQRANDVTVDLTEAIIRELDIDDDDPQLAVWGRIADARIETTLRASDPSRELVEAKAAYHEILYAVAQAYDGETRHQTALRYITEREAGNGDTRAAPAQGQSR